MAKPKISISPKSAYKLAPLTVRIAYLLMVASGALFLVDSLTGGAVLHLFDGSIGWVLLGALLAYMSHDSGLLVLRGRSLGTVMAVLFGAVMVTIGVLQFMHILGHGSVSLTLTATASTVIGVGIVGLVYLPVSRRYFAEAQRIRMAGSTPRTDYSNIDIGDAKPGSWDAIKAAAESTSQEK